MHFASSRTVRQLAAAVRASASALTSVLPRALARNASSKAAVSSRFADSVQHYEKQGYAIVRNVLDTDLVGEMREHVEFLQRRYPSIPTEHLHHHIMRNDAFWVRVCADSRLLDLAQAFAPFLADGVALFSSHYFLKKPRTGNRVLWHQDGSYWPLRPMNVMTLWVAVDASTKSNGCLRVVKGTHTRDLADLVRDTSVRNVLGSHTHRDEDIDPASIVDLELAPGDVSVHHPAIIHGSEPNTSETRRCGLTIRYISPATQCLNPDQPVLLLRGSAVPGVNEYRSWPLYRPGYDLPFAGSQAYNTHRHVNPADEAYFRRTDFDNMTAEITRDVRAFVETLGPT